MPPVLAFFEVLDKEPPSSSFWLAGLMFAMVGFIVCRWRWELLLLMAPLWMIFGWVVTSEFFDPYVGASMWAESHSYVYQLFGSVALAAFGPLAGAFWRHKRGPIEKITLH